MSEEVERGTSERPSEQSGLVSVEAGSTHTLEQFPEKLAVVRLPPGADIPSWVESASLLSVTATATETSIICAGRNVPRKTPSHQPYTGFAVAGTLDPSLVGVLHGLLTPLVEEQISVFTVSTYDTDWVLVPTHDAERAAEAWRRSGHTVAPAVPVDPSRKNRT